MRRISWIIIAISLLVSCQTPKEYIYVYPDPEPFPSIDEVISPELREEIDRPLDIIRAPETVGDLLHNTQEYQMAFFRTKDYADALEKYIDTIVSIHNGDAKENADVSI